MRPLPLLAGLGLLAAAPALAAEPYVQAEEYALFPGCCTFSFQPEDASLRLVIKDALGALGLSLGARADVHDSNHGRLRVVAFCADSGEVSLPPWADHVHVYPYDATTNLQRCGPATSLAPTAGSIEARMNGA
jgi:hypothetical protein